MGFGILVSPGCDFISVMFLKAWSIQNFGYDLRKPKSKSWLTIASLPCYEQIQFKCLDKKVKMGTYLTLLAPNLSTQKILIQLWYWDPYKLVFFKIIILQKFMVAKYSRVPNTTVGNPYSFFGACPSYMALFGTSRLLNFKKSSFLHFYSELLAY